MKISEVSDGISPYSQIGDLHIGSNTPSNLTYFITLLKISPTKSQQDCIIYL